MEQISAKVRKWGNSFGIILPKKIVDLENIREGLEVNVFLQPKNKMTVENLFQFTKKNKLFKLKKSISESMKEIDSELWPE